MAGATGDWQPGTPWYEDVFQGVKDTASNWFSFGVSNLTKAADLLPGQFLGPVGAVVKGARDVNRTSQTLFGNAAQGIVVPSNLLDPLLHIDKVWPSDEPTVLADTVVTAKNLSNMFTDTKDEPANGFTLPFWVKTAIVASVVIGTVLVVKGSMEHA